MFFTHTFVVLYILSLCHLPNDHNNIKKKLKLEQATSLLVDHETDLARPYQIDLDPARLLCTYIMSTAITSYRIRIISL